MYVKESVNDKIIYNFFSLHKRIDKYTNPDNVLVHYNPFFKIILKIGSGQINPGAGFLRISKVA